MPDHRHELFVSTQARFDFIEALLYSQEVWGPDQPERYEATLNKALRQLQSFPESGVELQGEIKGMRRLRAGHHMLYYTHDDRSVTIHRILHERRHVTPSLLMPDDD